MNSELSNGDKKLILDSIRDIPDFPKKGIVFKDITTLLSSPKAMNTLMSHLEQRYKSMKLDYIAGLDARGFIFGSILADRLGIGFVPIRKKGKLPGETISRDFELEYGNASIEIKNESLQNKKILLIDDLLATGGTVEAAIKMIKQLEGNIIGLGFLIELKFLKAREILKDYKIFSIVGYE